MTPKQTLIMWCLLGRHGAALQRDIGPKIEKKDREALAEDGYITALKQGNAYQLKMEDKGWHWSSEHLQDELPRNVQVLQHWLARLHDFLERNGTTLAEFIGPAPERPPEPVAKKRRTVRKPTSARLKTSPAQSSLRERIEAAYLAVTGGRKAVRALLSDVRAQLPDIDRETLDEALTRLHERDKTITLMRLDNPRDITPEVEQTQLMFKGEPLHLLWID